MASVKWNLMIRKLRQIQRLPLDKREDHAIWKIRNAIQDKWLSPKEICIAFSGGIDSIITADLVRRALVYPWGDYRDVVHIFENTLLEHRSLTKFVKEFFKKVNGVILYPSKSPKEIQQIGYPFLGKRIAEHIERIRNGRVSNWFIKNYAKYLPLTKINTPISAQCCYWLKKEPSNRFYAENPHIKMTVLGIRADESNARRQAWVENQCMHTPADGITQLKPISYFTKKDVWDYIRKYNLSYPEMYDLGYKRSGCMICGFGSHIECPNKFQILQRENLKFYLQIMNKWGYADAIREINEAMGYELIKGGMYIGSKKCYQMQLTT